METMNVNETVIIFWVMFLIFKAVDDIISEVKS